MAGASPSDRPERRVSRADGEPRLDLKFATLLDALYFEGKVAGPDRGVTFVEDDGQETLVSYLAALEKSLARAGALQRRGVGAGEPVLVVLPTSRDFLYLFFGLLYAGAIPCPVAPPASFAELADFGARVRGLATFLGARRLITVGPLRALVEGSLEGVELLLLEDLRVEARAGGPSFREVPIRADDVALIQCTSGSTGAPKAVMLTHENLISNVYQIGWCVDVRAEDVTVSWLPLYHDMGLIGCLLYSLYWNLDAVFLSPLRFLRQPATWLHAIARHRGSLSTAPNFAYGYAAARVTDAEMAGIDLSTWRLALCGAEPVAAATLRRFMERFARFGLRPDICTPCYGLAEATLAVTFHAVGAPLVVERLDRDALALRDEAREAAPGAADAVEVVSCGKPMPETRVRIVDAAGAPLPEGRVGRVLVSGPSVMKGYYRAPERTAETLLPGGWLETGDLGYLRGGALRITGRAKDLVVVRGRKYAPSDFEWAAEEVPGVRRGAAVAFGVPDAESGTEALVLVCETDLVDPAERAELAAAITTKVSERTGLRPARVALVERGTIPKTSSGKLRRARTRTEFLGNTLG